MSLISIVRALGGDLYAGGRRANVPAPGHSPADRSVSLLLDGDRVIAHSFGAADWRLVLEDLQARGLIDASGRLCGVESRHRVPAVSDPAPATRRRLACALWAERRPIAGSLAESHCRRRHVGRNLPVDLGWHPAVPFAIYAARGPQRPALLAAIRDREGEVAAVEVTYLAPNGDRARLPLPRKTVGVLPAGSSVRLDVPGPRLLVAEGVFSALSASECFQLPAWALLSTSNLRSWRAPCGVKEVLIAADRGDDGERSARRLADALRAEGVGTEIHWPAAPYADWNEVAAGGGGTLK